MDYHLFAHNILFLSGGMLNVILAFAVLFIQRKKLGSLVVTFALMSLSVATFQISHVFGLNADTAALSHSILKFNIVNIFIQAFMAHWFLVLTGKIAVRQHRYIMAGIYASGLIIFAISLIFPELFLHDSVPKMYFPFYYNPGYLYPIMLTWFFFVGGYYFYGLIDSYRKAVDPIEKNRYRYVTIAIGYAFVVGTTAHFLVFNVPFDPIWSSLFGLYPLLLVYTVVRYQLLEVRIIVQKAFVYALLVAVLLGFMSFSNFLSTIIIGFLPTFPAWAVPTAFSVIGAAIGIIIWNKLRENDLLKYEFITIIAHKFRTPLTQAKWLTENLLATDLPKESRDSLKQLQGSNERLISLTGTLVELTDVDNLANTLYRFIRFPVGGLVKLVVSQYAADFAAKKVTLSIDCPVDVASAQMDRERMKFVLQTLLENALAYTPQGGTVKVVARSSGRRARIAVSDSGIGIKREDISRIFSKFYRAKGAKLADTEGFGVGLFLAQSIARRHGGAIEVDSGGEGKGSTFTLVLPVAS